jgi:hypothetical protein
MLGGIMVRWRCKQQTGEHQPTTSHLSLQHRFASQPAMPPICADTRCAYCPPRSAELAAKLRMLEGKLLHGEQSGGLDRLAQQKAEQLRGQQVELRRQRAAEVEAARRIAALEASTNAVQTQYSSLQVGE